MHSRGDLKDPRYLDNATASTPLLASGLKGLPSAQNTFPTGWGGMQTKYVVSANQDIHTDGTKDLLIMLYGRT